ncbi:c-type cytochrome [Seohaeicola saemankumensis]|uniref:C-type cytochrome n=1 Tax=Seohaeicola saemankumensis TaxID=481181 RepID=A0ABW3THM9_9RHOB
MDMKAILAITAVGISAGATQADESALVLGKSTYGALCTVCHGDDAKGTGSVAELFAVKPPDLTTLTKRAGGEFPFADVYQVITLGMEAPGHGASEMPIWGDYFKTDALEDRGVKPGDAMYIAVGRVLSLTYYLESIQE